MTIKILDARSLPPIVQEHLRLRAVRAVLDGMGPVEVARTFGITRQAVHKWMQAHRRDGIDALRAKPQGRPRERDFAGA